MNPTPSETMDTRKWSVEGVAYSKWRIQITSYYQVGVILHSRFFRPSKQASDHLQGMDLDTTEFIDESFMDNYLYE